MKRALGLVVIAIVLGVGPAAHADAAQQALKKWFADLTADPAAAAKFTEGCQLVVLPRADGVVASPKSITVEDLVGKTTGTVSFKVKKMKEGSLYRLEAIGADVDATIKEGKKKRVVHLRVSALIPDEGPMEGKLVAGHFGVAIKDKDALAAAKAGTLPAPMAIAETIQPDSYESMQFQNIDRDDVAAWIDYKEPFVLGSGPGQTYTGKSGAKKIRKWKVTLARDGGMSCGSGAFEHSDGSAGSYCVGNVKATVKSGGKDVTMTYRMSVYYMSAPEDNISVALVHFSLAN